MIGTEAIYDVRESDNCLRTFETHFMSQSLNLFKARNPAGEGERSEHPAGRRGVRLRVLAAARGGLQDRHPPPHGSGGMVAQICQKESNDKLRDPAF